jgi:3-oxoacyl-[acyl-carrier-protein] synthase II
VPELAFDRPDRAAVLLGSAADEAIADAGLLPHALVCGTTLGGLNAWLPRVRSENVGNAEDDWSMSAPAERLANQLKIAGPVLTTSVACASGNVALGTALAMLRLGEVESVLCGGFDALSDFVVSGFHALKALDPDPCRPFDSSRRGLNLGEGAAFLVLEEEGRALRRGAKVRAFLDGYGVSADAVHMTGPDREGGGAARAMRAALDDAGLNATAIDFVSAHGTATLFNDLMEAKALASALGEKVSAQVPLHSIKSSLGHTLGASGALEAVASVRMLETGLLPATVGTSELDREIKLNVVRQQALERRIKSVLSSSSGFGGTNAAVVFQRGEAP